MSKPAKKTAAKKSQKPLSKSERIRRVMTKFVADGWDLNTISYSEVLTAVRGRIRGKSKAETASMRDAFTVTAAQVSIVKREFTGGSPTGTPGRPTHVAVGLVEAS